jgi:hypothetical protein
MSELILSSDTINEGRVKINNAYSATTNLWSASTGSNSIIADNSTGNLVQSTYSSILGGTGNLISGSTQYSAIVGGEDNVIYDSVAEFDCAIIGGQDTYVSNVSHSVALGGDSIISNNRDNTTFIQGLKTTKSRVRNVRIEPTITAYNDASSAIIASDDIVFVDINIPGPIPPSIGWSLALDGLAGSSRTGQTVELRVTNFINGDLFLGFAIGFFNGYRINDGAVDTPLKITSTNTLSVVHILNAGRNASNESQFYVYGIV